MRAVSVRCISLLAITLSSACFRYVEEVRPMTPADCGPEPPSKAFVSIVADSILVRGVSGRVFNADAEGGVPRPVWGASVIVEGMKRGTTTDSLGQFLIDSIPSGRYALRTRSIGYKPRLDSVVISDSFGQRATLGLVRDVTDGCPGFMSLVTRKRKWKWWF
jgi:hypothetical protein